MVFVKIIIRKKKKIHKPKKTERELKENRGKLQHTQKLCKQKDTNNQEKRITLQISRSLNQKEGGYDKTNK